MSLDLEQQYAVDALQEIDRICKLHNIEYLLVAGTTLGAVRHGGMIPWDNDIDIGLTYDNWIALRRIIVHELDPKFTYIDDVTDSTYPRFFGKVLYDGLGCLDVFLLAKWPLSDLNSLIHWRIRKFAVEGYKYEINKRTSLNFKKIKSMRYFFYILSTKIQKMIYTALHPFVNKDFYSQIARKLEHFYNNANEYQYINLYSIYRRKKEYIKREWVDSPSMVTFEGKKYPTMGDTDAYLTHLYGDYMTPPPESQRIKESRHTERFGEAQ